MNRDWTITLDDERVYTQHQWLELSMKERQNLLQKHKALFQYVGSK